MPFEPRGDIDAVAHQVAVALLDHVAEMNADAELDAAIRRHAGVALDHAVLHFDRAAHGVDDAAELDDDAVAGALDDAPVMHGDGRIDEIAAQRPQPRQDAILVRAGEPAVADDVRDKGSRPVFGSRPRRYAAATVSAVSGRPGKASGGHRKDARGMSIIGLSMAALPCCAEEDVEAGSAALRVDWPVYPRRAEHNTVAEGGNRRWAETARQNRSNRAGRGRPEDPAGGLSGAALGDVARTPPHGTPIRAANASLFRWAF